VQDFVFGVFDATMQLSSGIDYIKWDANRHVESPGSAYLGRTDQSRFWIDYTQGFYKVMERIRTKYPDVMIQACASGGGRVEYGALKYFDEVWTSDNTEARSRVKIQYGTSLFYPATAMGSHVSAVPNHQTNNITPLKFRFDIACAGRLGMELQPADMNDEEKAFARRAVENYKDYRDIVMGGGFIPYRYALGRQRLLLCHVRVERQGARGSLLLQHRVPRALAQIQIPPVRTRPGEELHPARTQRG
jgi:alpha-galactosidase